MTRHTVFATAAFLAALAPAARATSLYTASSQATDGTVIRCAIANVSTSPVAVTATITDQAGTDITNSGNCYGNPAVLDPGKLCFVESGIPGWKLGYCHFTASCSKVLVGGSGGVVTNGFAATR